MILYQINKSLYLVGTIQTNNLLKFSIFFVYAFRIAIAHWALSSD